MQGDANIPDDRGLYAEGQSWLNEKHIIGRVIGCVSQPSFLICARGNVTLYNRCSVLPCDLKLISPERSHCCRFLPYVGQVTIIMNDYPALKYALIGVLAVFVILSKE